MKLNRNRWTLLPMPMEVIEMVHHMVGKGFTLVEENACYDRNGERLKIQVKTQMKAQVKKNNKFLTLTLIVKVILMLMNMKIILDG